MMPELDQIFAALADPRRRAVVEVLRHGPQRPGELAAALSMSRPALSRHLKMLRSAGLIEQELIEDDGRGRTVRLCRATLGELHKWISEV